MDKLPHLFDRNRAWAARLGQQAPGFFTALAKQQTPEYLWIECCDSRTAANQIVDLPLGEIFVHRNIANVVAHEDINCMSAIQYAVEVLRVGHIIVCGHYGCGGVRAALENKKQGLIDGWLQHVRAVQARHAEAFVGLDDEASVRLLCELNVKAQVEQVCRCDIVQNHWKHSPRLAVHGWIYDIGQGHLTDLDVSVSGESIAG